MTDSPVAGSAISEASNPEVSVLAQSCADWMIGDKVTKQADSPNTPVADPTPEVTPTETTETTPLADSTIAYVVVFNLDHTVSRLASLSTDNEIVECPIPDGKYARALRDGFATYVKGLRDIRVVTDAGVAIAKQIGNLSKLADSLEKAGTDVTALRATVVSLQTEHDRISGAADSESADGVQTVATDAPAADSPEQEDSAK